MASGGRRTIEGRSGEAVSGSGSRTLGLKRVRSGRRPRAVDAVTFAQSSPSTCRRRHPRAVVVVVSFPSPSPCLCCRPLRVVVVTLTVVAFAVSLSPSPLRFHRVVASPATTSPLPSFSPRRFVGRLPHPLPAHLRYLRPLCPPCMHYSMIILTV